MTRIKFFATALLLLVVTGALAQSINYKALVKDGSGNVVANDLIVVQFQILQGGALTNVYQETHTPNTDANGFVILNIGEGSVNSGVFADIDWGVDDHYLNVQINTGGGLTDMGTTQFMAVPYALNAANAASKIDELSDGYSKFDVDSSLFLGELAGQNDDGQDNHNMGFGYGALHFNTTGGYNLAIGELALVNNTGDNNTAIGQYALLNNTDGSNNAAIGYNALNSNLTGNDNTATGKHALYDNTTGNNNTANGSGSLANNDTGSDNTATGYQALLFNTLGHSNTATGNSALSSNTAGGQNTATGFEALKNNTTGRGNVAVGYRALYNNNSSSGDNNTAIGDEALFNNTEGWENTGIGDAALLNLTTGTGNTAIGHLTLSDVTTGNRNIGIGSFAQVPNSTGSNQMRLGSTTLSYAGVQVAWTVTSDERWKENIRVLPYGLEVVKQLKPVDYIRKNNEHQTREMGFIAQDVEALLEKEGYTDQGFLTKDDNGFISLRYNDLIALLTKAIQEQQDIIEEQDGKLKAQNLKIDTQSADIKSLMTRMQKIENTTGMN